MKILVFRRFSRKVDFGTCEGFRRRSISKESARRYHLPEVVFSGHFRQVVQSWGNGTLVFANSTFVVVLLSNGQSDSFLG